MKPNGSFKEGELPGEYISNGSFTIKTPQLYSNFFPTIVRLVFKLMPINTDQGSLNPYFGSDLRVHTY